MSPLEVRYCFGMCLANSGRVHRSPRGSKSLSSAWYAAPMVCGQSTSPKSRRKASSVSGAPPASLWAPRAAFWVATRVQEGELPACWDSFACEARMGQGKVRVGAVIGDPGLGGSVQRPGRARDRGEFPPRSRRSARARTSFSDRGGVGRGATGTGSCPTPPAAPSPLPGGVDRGFVVLFALSPSPAMLRRAIVQGRIPGPSHSTLLHA